MDKTHLEAELRRLKKLARAWKGTAYRSATPPFAHDPEFLNGIGSQTNGNRWNPIGACATVYACLEVDNVVPEALAASRAFYIADANALPQVIRSLDCELTAVLDLRDPATQTALNLDISKILSEDWRAVMKAGAEAVSQTVGHAAFLAGFEALLVPSAVDQNRSNLVLFPDNLLPGNAIRPGADF